MSDLRLSSIKEIQQRFCLGQRVIDLISSDEDEANSDPEIECLGSAKTVDIEDGQYLEKVPSYQQSFSKNAINICINDDENCHVITEIVEETATIPEIYDTIVKVSNTPNDEESKHGDQIEEKIKSVNEFISIPCDKNSIKEANEPKEEKIVSIEAPGSFSTLTKLAIGNKKDDPSKDKRFGRKDDRDLFASLKKLCLENKIEMSDLWTKDKEIDGTMIEILNTILKQSNFRGSRTGLLKRIRSIASHQEFSVREHKLLKKIISNQLQTGKIDLNLVEYFYPGKSSIYIRKQVGEMLTLL